MVWMGAYPNTTGDLTRLHRAPGTTQKPVDTGTLLPDLEVTDHPGHNWLRAWLFVQLTLKEFYP